MTGYVVLRTCTMTETVSLLTITQWNRRGCLPILKDMILEQTYPHIVEWVLVEGSQTEEERTLNVSHLTSDYLTRDLPFPIRVIVPTGGLALGGLRQLANTKAVGDIRVVMDDDDYYPADRVAHAVERLRGSSAALAGCSNMLTVDYATDTMYQWAMIHDRHSVSACMAWKRDYDGVYDVNERVSDEFVFTRGFRAPMVQLDPGRTIVQTSHGGNTFLKELATSAGVVELADAIPLYVPLSYIERLRVTLS